MSSVPPPKSPVESESGAGRGGSNAPEYSVSEISGAIRRALEDGFGYVRIRGEVSGYRGPVASGHCYFALKDDKAKLDAVIWKGNFSRLRVKPEEGMEVIVHGKVTAFAGSSKYQIVIDRLEPAGAGALMAMLEERKRRLGAEGLFEDSRKKQRPFLPRVVGIVTSPTGAVIRDMLHGFDERFPTRVVVWPVRVQGEGSAAEIAAAIRGFNAFPANGPMPRPDVLIVARGGGSLEDLWSFNEEIVVRAAADSTIPLISAVGHETDWTLIDLVADARAPTPTKAAEWAVPKFAELVDALADYTLRQRRGLSRLLEARRNELKAAARGLPRRDDLIALPRQRLDTAGQRLDRGLILLAQRKSTMLARIAGRLTPAPIRNRLDRADERLAGVMARGQQALHNQIRLRRRLLDGQSALLSSLGYQSVLARGYALVRDASGQTVRAAARVTTGEELLIEWSDGRVPVRAVGDDSTTPVPPGKPAPTQAGPGRSRSDAGKKSSPSRGGPGDQGTLL